MYDNLKITDILVSYNFIDNTYDTRLTHIKINMSIHN